MTNKLRIIGLNIGAGKDSITGRGFFNKKNNDFCYIPIEETQKQRSKFTFRDLNNPLIRKAADTPCHYDPEFTTYTYGHVKRGFGDHMLYEPDLLNSDVCLFFYATLNIDNNPAKWGVFIIGFFEVDKIVNAMSLTKEQIFSLADFKNNAYLKREEPGVDLLIKGKNASKLFKHAIPLSKLDDPTEIDSKFADLITTTSGKKIEKSNSWHRWVLYSENPQFLEILKKQE
ncbi:MAG: hypothetical protein KKC75_03605 [Nanoarchaeota archaeon]|nr:hypothetical protein [Nanoarchaeota archaeon]MBU1005116.1 hypothetical protein [Nanoarchaeota archaeon]MBU1946819.1 hypothetical protein [Nanoarchaeota archaeon]